MKKLLLSILTLTFSTFVLGQGFAPTPQNWNVPNVEVFSEDMDQISNNNHIVLDMNGDGLPDLIDTEDNATDSTWQTGSQRFWKVYLGNGSSFNATAINWNVPNVEVLSEDMDQISNTNHIVLDMNGDGLPDLIDTEDNATDSTWQTGAQRFWKVYTGTGTSFSATAIDWNVPNVEVLSEDMDQISSTNHSVQDMNGDGLPDLIDTEDNATDSTWQTGTQRFWKVYISNGTSFSATAINWNVPTVETISEDMDQPSNTNYAVLDMNGDGMPDLIDSEDNITDSTWQTGAQRFWKVYLGNGTSFSATSTNWNVPAVEETSEDMDEIYNINYSVLDIDGDGLYDLIDAEDNITDSTWQTGTQRFWKVYISNGTSFSASAINWNVPNVEVFSEDMDQLSNTNYTVLDMNGDGKTDMIDTEDNVTDSTWQTGTQRYWIIYLNTSPIGLSENNNNKVQVFPNPFAESFTIEVDDNQQRLIRLYDISGKKILQESFMHRITLPVSALESGIYIFEIRGEDGAIISGKVLRQ
jgi:Secretion system C-terminal sorting domain